MGALAGIRVLDFSWVWSGPMTAACLADLGAEVIKVEHRDRLDNARMRGQPLSDGKPVEGPPEEISPYFHQNNRSKLSVTLNMKHPDGARLVRELAGRSDVVIENLTPGTFERAGLGYESLATENPRLVWLAMSAAGRHGPLAGIRAYAPVMTSLSGLEGLVGYEDEPAVGMMTFGIGDPNASSHALVALLAALVHRERTGEGQLVDMSQVEAMAAPLCEAFAELQVGGRDPAARGAAHPGYSPHGHFPCRGEDEWIALAVASDEQWERVVEILGGGALADRRFASSAGRKERRGELEALVAERTRARGRDELWERLRLAGVPAAPVLRLEEMQAQEHLRARGLFQRCVHPITGEGEVAGVPWRMSATQPRVRRAAPLVGEHTREALGRILGLSGEELDAHERSGALR